MRIEIDKLIEDIISDFANFTDHNGDKRSEESVQQFRDQITINEGSKYIRIECGSSVWGFINKTNRNFHPGDIFKPKNWKTPTLNRSRGNILSGRYQIAWTGPLYLHDIAGKGFYSWQSDELARTSLKKSGSVQKHSQPKRKELTEGGFLNPVKNLSRTWKILNWMNNLT